MGSNPTVANPLGRSPMGEQTVFDTRMGVERLDYKRTKSYATKLFS